MKMLIWASLLGVALLLEACSSNANAERLHPEGAKRFVVPDIEESIRVHREQRRREEADRIVAQERRWAEEERVRKAEYEARAKAERQLAAAMYTFGVKRLDHVRSSPRLDKIYKAQVNYVAHVISGVVEENGTNPLMSVDEDPYLLAALAFHESSWTQSVIDGRRRGRRGEIGMMQIMPGGVCSFSQLDANRRPLDPLDPRNNVRLASACLKRLQTRYEDPTIWRVLARYASGKEWPSGRDAIENPVNGLQVIYTELRASRPEA